ncbi:hypothetical protein ACUNV4_19555 [Granulosicoccus sp. 3-233]|uniref:hypothetical protein n=1 Tax=Granulosicoccus sp. 3-233 TaxID=3417969 RepID=UPI003D34723E
MKPTRPSIARLVHAVSCLFPLLFCLPLAANTLTPPQITITTQLTEVQRGTFDGRDYLTLHIGGHEIGPSGCRSNILRMDTSSAAGAARQEEIETLALSAMLSGSLVVVVVPLDASQCVDGKPTFTDLYLSSSSP